MVVIKKFQHLGKEGDEIEDLMKTNMKKEAKVKLKEFNTQYEELLQVVNTIETCKDVTELKKLTEHYSQENKLSEYKRNRLNGNYKDVEVRFKIKASKKQDFLKELESETFDWDNVSNESLLQLVNQSVKNQILSVCDY